MDKRNCNVSRCASLRGGQCPTWQSPKNRKNEIPTVATLLRNDWHEYSRKPKHNYFYINKQ